MQTAFNNISLRKFDAFRETLKYLQPTKSARLWYTENGTAKCMVIKRLENTLYEYRREKARAGVTYWMDKKSLLHTLVLFRKRIAAKGIVVTRGLGPVRFTLPDKIEHTKWSQVPLETILSLNFKGDAKAKARAIASWKQFYVAPIVKREQRHK